MLSSWPGVWHLHLFLAHLTTFFFTTCHAQDIFSGSNSIGKFFCCDFLKYMVCYIKFLRYLRNFCFWPFALVQFEDIEIIFWLRYYLLTFRGCYSCDQKNETWRTHSILLEWELIDISFFGLTLIL